MTSEAYCLYHLHDAQLTRYTASVDQAVKEPSQSGLIISRASTGMTRLSHGEHLLLSKVYLLQHYRLESNGLVGELFY